ncbi:MAG: sugar ABC transporter permease [Chloroflexi bacterium]|nr:sugar ABC transporter permease [Chloroflexota bacterium]
MAARSPTLTGVTRRPTPRPAATPYLLALPVVLYVGALVLYPIAQGIYTSFTRAELLSGAPPVWVGLANYERMLRDPGFWRSLLTTFIYTTLVVVTTVIASVLTALLMNAKFFGRSGARAAITLPYAFPEVAAVLLWAWMFSQQFGVLNVFARWLLPIPENLPWLSEPRLAMFSVLAVTLWKIFPFYSLVVLTALQTVEAELYEAARIDGAGPIAAFRYVTLPGIAPTLGIMTLLVTIFSFRRFTILFLLTGGGPADSTQTLVIRVYQTAFRFFELSYGATLGVAGLVVTLIITAAYFAALRRGREAAT